MTARLILRDSKLLQYLYHDQFTSEAHLSGEVQEWLDDQSIAYQLKDNHPIFVTTPYLIRSTIGFVAYGHKALEFENIHDAALFRLRWL